MATMKEKLDEFVALLGGNTELAQSVVQQAEATAKAAQEAGLKFKEGDAVVDDKAAKPVVEGSPEEEKKEPPAEAAAEPDWEAMSAKMAPHINKMIEAKMAAAKKETTEKEAGLTAQITALQAKVKEVEAVAKTLAGDLPRSVKDGYRASQSASTITTKELPNQPAPDPLGDFYGWVTESLGHQPAGSQPVQPPGA